MLNAMVITPKLASEVTLTLLSRRRDKFHAFMREAAGPISYF
jgi:hypothetical protein